MYVGACAHVIARARYSICRRKTLHAFWINRLDTNCNPQAAVREVLKELNGHLLVAAVTVVVVVTVAAAMYTRVGGQVPSICIAP